MSKLSDAEARYKKLLGTAAAESRRLLAEAKQLIIDAEDRAARAEESLRVAYLAEERRAASEAESVWGRIGKWWRNLFDMTQR